MGIIENITTIAIVKIYDERHRHLAIDERATALGLSRTTYIFYLDKWANIVCRGGKRVVELLRSQYASNIKQPNFATMNNSKDKKHRANKYESDVKCAQYYHDYLLGKQTRDPLFWYYVERHNDLYGNDPHYTAIFNGNQARVIALMQLRGEGAYQPAP